MDFLEISEKISLKNENHFFCVNILYFCTLLKFYGNKYFITINLCYWICRNKYFISIFVTETYLKKIIKIFVHDIWFKSGKKTSAQNLLWLTLLSTFSIIDFVTLNGLKWKKSESTKIVLLTLQNEKWQQKNKIIYGLKPEKKWVYKIFLWLSVTGLFFTKQLCYSQRW